MAKTLWIIEDNPDLAAILKARFGYEGFQLKTVSNGMDLLSSLSHKDPAPDILILDLMLPGRSGYELLNPIRSCWPQTKIFIFSSYKEYEKQIPKELIDGFFVKTDGVEKLAEAVLSVKDKEPGND